MTERRIAVACAGLDVNIPTWSDIAWGDPQKGVLGRVAQAIKLAVELDAEALIISTGATEKDDVSEAEFTRRFAEQHLNKLFDPESDAFDKAMLFLDPDDRCVIDKDSQNTAQLINWAFAQCDELSCEQLWFLTDQTNLPRLVRDALEVAGNYRTVPVFTAAGTGYGTPAIAEPPINRKDDGAPNMASLLNRYFRLTPEQQHEVAAALQLTIAAAIGNSERPR